MQDTMRIYLKLLPTVTLITFLIMINLVFLINFFSKRKNNKKEKKEYEKAEINKGHSKPIENPYSNLIKYCKNGQRDINFIEKALSKKSHPHNKIIEDNFKMLKKLIDKNQKELDMTMNEKRKHMIEIELYSIISKYIDLINNLNINLIQKDLDVVKKINEEVELILESLNEESEDCIKIFTESYCYTEIKSVNNYINNIQIFLDYLKHIKYYNYNNLKKIIMNDKSNYYKSLMNLLNIIIFNVNNLTEKKEYLSDEMAYGIDNYIQTLMINFAKTVIKLDNVYIPPINYELKRYSELLDSVNNDIKNNNSIFK